MAEFLSYLLPGICVGCVYAVIGLGLITIYRTTGVVNLAQGEFFMFGAYAMIFFAFQLGFPIWIGLVMLIAAFAFLGMFTERVLLRPLVGQPIIAIVLMTLALGAFIRGIMTTFWSDQARAVPSLFTGYGGVEIFGANISMAYFWFAIVSVALFGILWYFFNHTKMGLLMKGTADATQLAQSCGVNVNVMTRMAWVIALVACGLGGYLLCTITGVNPAMSTYGLRSIVVVLAAGLESIGGCMIMGPVIGAIEYIGAGYLDPLVGGGIKEVMAFIVLFFFLIFRPQGLWGWKIIERL